MSIPSQFDELFQVNVAKKHLTLPKELKESLIKCIQPIIQIGQEFYRNKLNYFDDLPLILKPNIENISKNISNDGAGQEHNIKSKSNNQFNSNSIGINLKYGKEINELIDSTIIKYNYSLKKMSSNNIILNLLRSANPNELETLISIMKKYIASSN